MILADSLLAQSAYRFTIELYKNDASIKNSTKQQTSQIKKNVDGLLAIRRVTRDGRVTLKL